MVSVGAMVTPDRSGFDHESGDSKANVSSVENNWSTVIC